MRRLHLDPRQQLALFGVFVLVLAGSVALPVADGVLAGGIVRLFRPVASGVSLPVVAFANLLALVGLGGAVGIGVVEIRRRAAGRPPLLRPRAWARPLAGVPPFSWLRR